MIDTENMNVITAMDPLYPASLLDLGADAPACLYVLGDPSLLTGNGIAVIGSRWPDPLGIAAGRAMTDALISAADAPVIVSGLATGCDTIGHTVALENGCPTVAVLPGGFDHITPEANIPLAEMILASGGALVSEYPPSTPVKNSSFTRRDRIIAALAGHVAVIQCGLRSGTMATVNCALKLGRPVCACAVPGPRATGISGSLPHTISAGSQSDPSDLWAGNAHLLTEGLATPISDPSTDVSAFLAM